MVRTAAETFFYNFNESKFFLDESKYLRVARKVCTITTPPVDHLKIIDELYRGGQIYMTLYPQKPGTYFGAEICKCQWEPRGCHRRTLEGGEVRDPAPRIEDRRKQAEISKLSFSRPSTASKRGSAVKGMPGDGPPAKYLRASPEKVLRMKKSVVDPLQSDNNPPPRKSKSSPGKGDFGMQTVNNAEMPGLMESRNSLNNNDAQTTGCYQANESRKSAEKPLRMKNQKGTDAMPPPPKTSADGIPKTGRSVSRVALQPAETAEAPTETQQNLERRTTTASQGQVRRRTTWGFIDMKKTSRSQSRVSPQRPDSPSPSERREPSPKKSQTKIGDDLPNCYHCRKCTEKLCLKCRMPVDSCCCGIPNFLYCRECEENIAGSAKNVGDPFKCRKCDQKLCLVCRQHVDSCCCPKPNFFVCRSCETRRRTRCCIPIQR